MKPESALAGRLARHLRQVHVGENWTSTDLKDLLSDVGWEQANRRIRSFHTIAELVYHANYYIAAVLGVFRGEELTARDKFSFDCPPIDSAQAWEDLQSRCWREAEALACEVERMPDSKLWEVFVDAQYGDYYRNLQGLLEHCHYHLGQIALIKSMTREA